VSLLNAGRFKIGTPAAIVRFRGFGQVSAPTKAYSGW
jgi:hypothetical protein